MRERKEGGQRDGEIKTKILEKQSEKENSTGRRKGNSNHVLLQPESNRGGHMQRQRRHTKNTMHTQAFLSRNSITSIVPEKKGRGTAFGAKALLNRNVLP